MFELSTLEAIYFSLSWWLIGFLPGIWAANAARRSSNRWRGLTRPMYWSDLVLPFWLSFLGPFAAVAHILTAILFECSERHWFDFLDRPIFSRKDK